jgi:mannose-6-phosphate isomerase-like protein (cupin superfamily)
MYTEWGHSEFMASVGKTLSLTYLTVDPGESITGRDYDTSKLFYVVNGTGKCELELGFIKKKSTLIARNTVYVSVGITFKITNSGPHNLTLIEIEHALKSS